MAGETEDEGGLAGRADLHEDSHRVRGGAGAEPSAASAQSASPNASGPIGFPSRDPNLDVYIYTFPQRYPHYNRPVKERVEPKKLWLTSSPS